MSKFEELAALNVNAHIEKKNGLSYLSWAWAVDCLMRQDAEADWDYPEPKMFGDTMMVYCTVRAFGKARTAHLPVMDHRNQPIKMPNAFQVNTAMQRALVKAIALHGIGLYIYAGEDLPQGDDKATDKAADIKPVQISANAGAGESLNAEERVRVEGVAGSVIDWLNEGSPEDAFATLDNAALEVEEKTYLWSLLDSKQRAAIKKVSNKQKEAA